MFSRPPEAPSSFDSDFGFDPVGPSGQDIDPFALSGREGDRSNPFDPSDIWDAGLNADASDPAGTRGTGTGSGGHGPSGPKRIIPAILALVAIALLAVVLCIALPHKGDKPGSIPLPEDSGEICTTVTARADGSYHLQMTHELTGLDPKQFYVAGFMMAPEGQSLVAIHEPAYFSKTDCYTATAEIVITRPGRYQIAFYSYPLNDPLPSITRTMIIEIGGGAPQPLPSDGSAIIVVTPSPSPTPTPAPTPQPFQPTQEPWQHLPSSALFGLYDIGCRYYYHQLTDVQKQIFAEMYDGVAGGMTSIRLSPCMEDDFLMALDVLRYDCPELFLWDYEQSRICYTSNAQGQVIAFEPGIYVYSVTEYEEKLRQVLAGIQALSALPGFDGSDINRQQVIYDSIIRQSTYDLERRYCAYADSVFLYHYSKCSGYAYALSLALRCYGIPSAVVIGNTSDNGRFVSQLHMWTAAQIDGEWYYCDATWDDRDTEPVSHAYLNLNDRLTFATRVPDDLHDRLRLPVCTSVSANAIMREGIYVAAGSDIERTIVDNLVAALAGGGGRVQLLFESGADYSTALILLKREDIGNDIARAAHSDYRWRYIFCSDINYIDITVEPGS